MRMQTALELEDSATIGPFRLAMVAWINVGEGAGHHLPQHLRLEHLNSFRNFSLQAPWRYQLKPFVSILEPGCRASRIPFDSYITSPLALLWKRLNRCSHNLWDQNKLTALLQTPPNSMLWLPHGKLGTPTTIIGLSLQVKGRQRHLLIIRCPLKLKKI